MSKIDEACDEWMYQRTLDYNIGDIAKITRDFVNTIIIPYYPTEADNVRIHEISFVTDMAADRLLDILETVIINKNPWERLNE